MRKVEVSSYNERWPAMFEEEVKMLYHIFGKEIISIHHIGSTSVPGLQAKPIIDIMPVVRDIYLIDSYNEAMREIGYIPKGENGIHGRRYFQKGGKKRTHHVHMFQVGSSNIKRHLAFRDYLRAHAEVKKRYGELKTQLAEQYPYDIESYIEGKNDLVKKIERKALQWKHESY